MANYNALCQKTVSTLTQKYKPLLCGIRLIAGFLTLKVFLPTI